MTRYVLFLLGIVLLFLAACADMPLTAEPTEFVAVVEERDGEETAVSPTSAPTIFPTRTLAPTATSTTQPTETATMLPTPMPTLSIRVEAGTAVPHSHQPITTDNVTQLAELARWGRGVINDIALSGNGRWLAVGTATGVYIHDAEDLSKTVYHLETPAPVESVAISPEGSVIVLNLVGELIQVWNVHDDQLIYEKAIAANDVKISPNEEQIILTNYDGVYILPINTNEIDKEYPDATGAEFSPDNDQLAVWNNNLLSLYTWPDGKLLRQAEPASFLTEDYGEYPGDIVDARFLPEGELLMSALPINPAYRPTGRAFIQKVSDESVILTANGIAPLTEPTKYVCNDPIFYWHRPPSPVPWQMDLSPNGQVVAFTFRDAGYDGDSENHTSIRFYQLDTEQLLYSIEEGIKDISISPNGEMWAAGLQDGRLQIRSLSDGSVLDSVDDYDAPALKTAVSPDSEWVAVEYLNEIKIFQAANGEVVYQYPAQRIAFSPDGETFALGYDDGRLEIRSLADNQLLKTIFGHSEGITAVAFLPSGELVSAGLDCQLQVWQPESGVPLKTFENHIVEGEVSGNPVPVRVWDLSISEENELLVGDFAWTVGIWRIEDGALLNVLDRQSHSENSATFSNSLAIAGYPLLVGQFDADGQLAESWKKDNSDFITAITFSSDGEMLISGLYNGTLQLFSAENGDFGYEIYPESDWVTGLKVAPNGRYFVSTTIDGVTRLWGIPSP